MRKTYLFILSILISGACTNISDSGKNKEGKNDPAIPNAYFVNAILYNYFSAEYKALAYQAFNAASDHIELVKLKNPHRTDLAIVLDIDETILDNSPYQARLFELNTSYDSLWNTWCNMSQARPIPGSVEFLKLADSMGYHIFYITNRKEKHVLGGTLTNIQNAGFPQADSSHLLMRTADNSKESRRNKVRETYEIVMLVGDNIADLYEDTSNFVLRDKTVKMHKGEFGRRLIVLPNSIYGNWTESLNLKTQTQVDSLISIMTQPFTAD